MDAAMGKKAKADHTPAEQRAAIRWRVDPEQFASLKIAIPPEQRAKMAQLQEQARLMGEKTGLRRFAEQARLMREMRREAETAPPSPQEPTPQRRKRKQGGGNKPMLPEKTIDLG